MLLTPHTNGYALHSRVGVRHCLQPPAERAHRASSSPTPAAFHAPKSHPPSSQLLSQLLAGIPSAVPRRLLLGSSGGGEGGSSWKEGRDAEEDEEEAASGLRARKERGT